MKKQNLCKIERGPVMLATKFGVIVVSAIISFNPEVSHTLSLLSVGLSEGWNLTQGVTQL